MGNKHSVAVLLWKPRRHFMCLFNSIELMLLFFRHVAREWSTQSLRLKARPMLFQWATSSQPSNFARRDDKKQFFACFPRVSTRIVFPSPVRPSAWKLKCKVIIYVFIMLEGPFSVFAFVALDWVFFSSLQGGKKRRQFVRVANDNVPMFIKSRRT